MAGHPRCRLEKLPQGASAAGLRDKSRSHGSYGVERWDKHFLAVPRSLIVPSAI